MRYTKEQRKERYYEFKKRGICVNCECRSAVKGHVRCLKCQETINERNRFYWQNVKKNFKNISEKEHKSVIFKKLEISNRLIPRPDGIDKNDIFVELKKAMPNFVHGLFTTKSKYFPELYFKKNSTEWDSEFIDKQIEADIKYLEKIRVIIVKGDELGKILIDRILTKNDIIAKSVTVK
jgi:hypothetical protein